MFKNQTFENNIYMKLFRLAYIFLVGNLCFVLVNLPFFFVAITSALDLRNSVFFLIASLPILPSLLTLMLWINKWHEEKDIDPFKTFFSLYKKMWLEGFKLGGISFLLSLIGIVDILFFIQVDYGKWLVVLFFILIVASTGLLLNNFYFRSKNPELSFKIINQTSLYFSLKKWYFSLLNTVLLLAVFLLMILKPQFGFTITPVLFVGLIYLNCTQLYKVKEQEVA